MHNSGKSGVLGLLFGSLFLLSCSSGYQVVRSERSGYAINSGLPADSAVIRAYLPYKKRMDETMNSVIGYSSVPLTKTAIGGESVLGNFFSDAALSQARKIQPDIDFAMPSTNGGLRNDLPEGAITLANVFELMPFENELIVYELDGQAVQNLLNYIARTGGQPVSGITLQIKSGKPSQVLIGGRPFDPARHYQVLTSDYIAGGGDGVTSFQAPVRRQITGLKIRDALVQFIKEKQAGHEKIYAHTDNRISHD